jgi:hypothetical protein
MNGAGLHLPPAANSLQALQQENQLRQQFDRQQLDMQIAQAMGHAAMRVCNPLCPPFLEYKDKEEDVRVQGFRAKSV